jgi:DNA-binding MarR family transcriptional regulator
MPTSESVPAAGLVLETLLRTTHQLHLQFESHLTALDIPDYLSGPRLRFLVSVSEAGQIRMSEIAAKLGIKPRTVTQFVDALEQEKLIVRIPDPDDRRATFIKLSETAPPLIQKARLAMSESADIVLASLSPEDRGQLLRLLHQITEQKERIL